MEGNRELQQLAVGAAIEDAEDVYVNDTQTEVILTDLTMSVQLMPTLNAVSSAQICEYIMQLNHAPRFNAEESIIAEVMVCSVVRYTATPALDLIQIGQANLVMHNPKGIVKFGKYKGTQGTANDPRADQNVINAAASFLNGRFRISYSDGAVATVWRAQFNINLYLETI